MKKESLTHAAIGVLLAFSALLLTRCNTSAENKAPIAKDEASLVGITPAEPATDTSWYEKEVQAVNERETAAQKETPTPQPISNATPVAEKAKATKPKPSSKAEFSLKSAKAVIKGSSSLHDWESEVTKMEGKGTFETKAEELVAIKDVEIKIAVKGIKSKEGKKMDKKTYETFQSDKHPNIVYTFSNAVVKINDSNIVTIEAKGKLTMAGNTQPVSLSATGKKLANGDLKLSVSKKIKMTDYKMEPPVMMLGTIKVGDEITVDFDFVLAKTK